MSVRPVKSTGNRALLVLRSALLIGFAIDAVIAVFALFFPAAMGPLFDVPLKDPAATMIAGGEFLVVALLYLAIFLAPRRYRALLVLVALDQALAAVLPAILIGRGDIPATWKTIGPIPINALLAATYAFGLRWLQSRGHSPAPAKADA